MITDNDFRRQTLPPCRNNAYYFREIVEKWQSCLILNVSYSNCLRSTNHLDSKPNSNSKVQLEIELQTVIEGENLTNIDTVFPMKTRSEWKQHSVGSLTKRHTGPLRVSIPSTHSVTLPPHLLRMNSNKLSSIVYDVATSLSPIPRISLRRRLAERSLSLSHPDWDFNESSESLMAEAQKSLAVVLPESIALSEIISCIRQKGVFFTAKKEKSEKSCYVYCRLCLRFLGVPLFGAKIGVCTLFWRSPKIKICIPNKWRTIKSLVHKIRFHGRRGEGTAESFSRKKL